MAHFVYPKSWNSLNQVPSSRLSLIELTNDIVSWNNDSSGIKRLGADTVVGFLFDIHNMGEDVKHLTGELIFSDEVEPLERFIQLFDNFLNEWQDTHGTLNTLHEAILPNAVVEAAREFHEKLKERGLPQWIEDPQ